MRIKVRTDEHRISLRLPTGLLLSPLAAHIASHAIRNGSPEPAGAAPSASELKLLFRELRACMKTMKGMPLVEVSSPDGTEVYISL